MTDIHKQFDEFYKNQSKMFGEGTAFLPRLKTLASVQFVKTGIPEVDDALGGGIPRGRCIELFGMESSGKTSFSLHMANRFQTETKDKLVGFIDAENALDIYQAEHTFKVNMDDMPITQLEAGEDSLTYLENACRSGLFSLIILDSVDSLLSRSELEGDLGDSNMGRKGMMMSDAMRKISYVSSKSNTTVIFINQIRNKVGMVFGSREYTSGGNALKFYASQRIDMRKKEFLDNGSKENPDLYGIRSKFKVVKNKVGRPFQTCEPELIWNEGFDTNIGGFRKMVEDGVIKKAGAWFSYGDERIGQGQKVAFEWYKENIKLFEDKL